MGKASHIEKDRTCLACGQKFFETSKGLRDHFRKCATPPKTVK